MSDQDNNNDDNLTYISDSQGDLEQVWMPENFSEVEPPQEEGTKENLEEEENENDPGENLMDSSDNESEEDRMEDIEEENAHDFIAPEDSKYQSSDESEGEQKQLHQKKKSSNTYKSPSSGSSSNKKKKSGSKTTTTTSRRKRKEKEVEWELQFPTPEKDESLEEFNDRFAKEKECVERKMLEYESLGQEEKAKQGHVFLFQIVTKMDDAREANGFERYYAPEPDNEISDSSFNRQSSSATNRSQSNRTESTQHQPHPEQTIIPLGDELSRFSTLQARLVDATNYTQDMLRKYKLPYKYPEGNLNDILIQLEDWFGLRKPQDQTMQYSQMDFDQMIYSRFLSTSNDAATIMDDVKTRARSWLASVQQMDTLMEYAAIKNSYRDRLICLRCKMTRIFARVHESAIDALSMNSAQPGSLLQYDPMEYDKKYDSIFNDEKGGKKSQKASSIGSPYQGAESVDAEIEAKKLTKMPIHFLLEAMGKEAARRGYRRDGYSLYAECLWPELKHDLSGVAFVPMAQHKVNAFEMAKEMSIFLYEISRRDKNASLWHYRVAGSGTVGHLLNEFANNEEPDVQRLNRCRHAFSFTNVFYDAKTDYWSPHDQRDSFPLPTETIIVDDHEEQRVIVGAKFIKQALTDIAPCGPHFVEHNEVCYNLDGKRIYDRKTQAGKEPIRSWMEIATPNAETIFNDQGWEPLVKMWMYFMLGRLIFNIGEKYGGDGLQICPLLYGKAGTYVNETLQQLNHKKKNSYIDLFFVVALLFLLQR
jgi:hypothetical protein